MRVVKYLNATSFSEFVKVINRNIESELQNIVSDTFEKNIPIGELNIEIKLEPDEEYTIYDGKGAESIEQLFKQTQNMQDENALDILDNMNEDELVANLFRINQTKQKLLKDNVQGEKEAKDVHYEVGKKVRHAIADIGGMMPEEMPTPKKSLKELEREKKQLENKENKKLEGIK